MATTAGTWQDRNASATLPAVVSLAVDSLKVAHIGPQFAALESSTMGNLGQSTDGFDIILNAALLEEAGEALALAGLDSDLFDLPFTAGAISGVYYNPVASDITTWQAVGDKQISDYSAGVGATTPPPAPAPAPSPKPKPAPAPKPGPGGPTETPGCDSAFVAGTPATASVDQLQPDFYQLPCQGSSAPGTGVQALLTVQNTIKPPIVGKPPTTRKL